MEYRSKNSNVHQPNVSVQRDSENLVTGDRGDCRALPVGVVREWQCRGIWGQLMTPGVWSTGAVTSSACAGVRGGDG